MIPAVHVWFYIFRSSFTDWLPGPPWSKQNGFCRSSSGSDCKTGIPVRCHEQSIQFLITQYKAISDGQEKILASLQGLQPTSVPVPSQPAPFIAPKSSTPPDVTSSEPQAALLFRDASTPDPELFAGEQGCCGGFLLQCDLVFGWSPRSLPNHPNYPN